MKQNDPDITIKLSDFVKIFLGDNFYLPFPKGTRHLGQIVESKCKLALDDKGVPLYHVQWPDKYNPSLSGPVLWLYYQWVESTEKWERNKKLSEERVLAFNLFNANVRQICKAMMKLCLMDEDYAMPKAYSLLKNNKLQNIRGLGVEKLLTQASEL